MEAKAREKLSRAKVIAIAVEQIQSEQKEFLPAQYNLIQVYKKNEVFKVYFTQSIKFVPENSEHYYDVFVEIGENSGSGYGILKNPHNYEAKTPTQFLKITPAIQKKIKFVIQAINKSKEIGVIPKEGLPEGYTLEIYAQPQYYQIIADAPGIASRYQIDKKTGKVGAASHKEKMLTPKKQDGFELMP